MRDDPFRGAATIDKGLGLLFSIVADGGQAPLSALARREGVALSTAQRLVSALMRAGLVCRIERGRYAGGLGLAQLAGAVSARSVLTSVARAPLRRLARDLRATVHLGVLEGDMVTYLLKACGGGPEILTREMMQLEAYCSGIGKVLLAHLDPAGLEAYLSEGPFIALTPKTLTDPDSLRAAFQQALAQGYAIDDGEVEEQLFCLAAPIFGPRGGALAAISVSNRSSPMIDPVVLQALQACAAQIGRRLGVPPQTLRRGRSINHGVLGRNDSVMLQP